MWWLQGGEGGEGEGEGDELYGDMYNDDDGACMHAPAACWEALPACPLAPSPSVEVRR